jgi:hypothetical protein
MDGITSLSIIQLTSGAERERRRFAGAPFLQLLDNQRHTVAIRQCPEAANASIVRGW